MFIAEQQYRDASTRALGVLEHDVETEAIRAYRPTTGGAVLFSGLVLRPCSQALFSGLVSSFHSSACFVQCHSLIICNG